MKCTELTNDLLQDYGDWRLDPHDRNRVARHLEDCGGCRARREEVEIMTTALRQAGEAPPPALLRELDAAVLGSLPRLKRLPRPRRGLIVGAAAAVLLVAIVVFLTSAPPPPAAPTGEAPAVSRVEPPAVSKVEPPAPTVPPIPAPPTVVEPPAPEPTATPRSEPAPPPSVVSRVEPPAVSRAEPPAVEARRGDLNADGQVDIADARIITRLIAVGQPVPSHADVNADGSVDISDARDIARAVVRAP